MFGMYAALKSYLERDHQKEWQDWLDRISRIKSRIESLPSVKSETHSDPGPANAFPSLHVGWDQNKIKITPRAVVTALKEGSPSIVANTANKGEDERLSVGVVLLRPDQIDIVAGRVREILQKALSGQ
jgi:L-seryl-tRNA(Ser) seleniumtransferase